MGTILATIWFCLLLAFLLGLLLGWLLWRRAKTTLAVSPAADSGGKLRRCEEETARLQSELDSLKKQLRAGDATMADLQRYRNAAEWLRWRVKKIQFEPDSTEFTGESLSRLEEVFGVLKSFPTVNVEIGGHTDNVDTEEHNRDLSMRRADAVRGYLVARGIPADRLTTVGYGSLYPISDNDTAEGRWENRRIEFVVLSS